MDICLNKTITKNDKDYKNSTIALGVLFGLSFIIAVIFAVAYFKIKKK